MALRPSRRSDRAGDTSRVHVPLWRRVLALPFQAAAYIAYLIGKAIHSASRLGARIATVWGAHVYYVFVQLRRWVRGEPAWQAGDLDHNLQPRTDAQIAYARAHPDVVEVKCDCGEPDCDLAKRLRSQPHFMDRTKHLLMNVATHQRISTLVNAEIDRVVQADRAARSSTMDEKN